MPPVSSELSDAGCALSAPTGGPLPRRAAAKLQIVGPRGGVQTVGDSGDIWRASSPITWSCTAHSLILRLIRCRRSSAAAAHCPYLLQWVTLPPPRPALASPRLISPHSPF